MIKKKLIEVALPLEKINAAAAYEKMPGIGAHPRGLHLWWARRPLTTARAVIWASLVDDPSAHPEKFATEEEQNVERNRLFRILEDLVEWKNSSNEEVIRAAKEEILKSTGNTPPELLDPFAGGGAIPLEAMRLGLNVHAHDLNPVSVMINKSMIEIPTRFVDTAPVNPENYSTVCTIWRGVDGLAEDVKYYGKWMEQEVQKQIGHFYPKVKVPEQQGGGEATVIAWLWTRTVTCPNPACKCSVPLIKSFDLAKKKGREASVKLDIDNGRIRYRVEHEKSTEKGTISRRGGICPCCNAAIEFSYIRNEATENKVDSEMIAVVAESKGGRIYITPDDEQKIASRVCRPADYPSGTLFGKARVNVSLYGFDETSDLFTNRQLTTLTTFSNVLEDVQKQIEKDAIDNGFVNDHIPLSEGGKGALAYSQAVTVYLAFAVDRLADFSTSVSRWAVTNEKAMNCFSKQAIPMTWDYPEVNMLGNSVGSVAQIIDYIVECIKTLPADDACGVAAQHDAQSDCGLRNIMVSTDPPYYDNISYADLSDFFYVWMRNSLKNIYPQLFSTMLVPKTEELVATPYRFDGNVTEAKNFFEEGMLRTCQQIYQYAREDIPVTIYYAYKQSESEEDDTQTTTASTGWETMLSAIIRAGFAITGTWPMRTEQAYRAIGMNANALASSIVLVCRKRGENKLTCTRRNFINELKRELRPALQNLQRSNIAPVDLAQSAIGPGIAVYSKYEKVLEADGSPMTVRSALQIINQELDVFFNEQDGELDRESRFCVELYTQNAFNDINFGDADTLARAKNTSVAALASRGVLYAQKGVVHLYSRDELTDKVLNNESLIWLLTQQLTHAMETGGIEACARIVAPMYGSNAEYAKSLAYRLFTIAERKGWAQEAYAYNSLVIAWTDIQSRAAEIQAIIPEQMSLFDYMNT